MHLVAALLSAPVPLLVAAGRDIREVCRYGGTRWHPILVVRRGGRLGWNDLCLARAWISVPSIEKNDSR